MSEALTFDLNEIFEQQTSDELVREATAFKTLPSGKYRLAVAKAEGRVTPSNFSHPGVQMVHLQVDAVSHTEVGVDGNPVKGKLFVDLCPTVLRRDDGKLDSSSKRWGQYQKAVDKIGAPVGEVIEAIKLYPVDAYVAEGFKMPDQSYQFPRNVEERKVAVDGGGEAKNFVQGIYKVAAALVMMVGMALATPAFADSIVEDTASASYARSDAQSTNLVRPDYSHDQFQGAD